MVAMSLAARSAQRIALINDEKSTAFAWSYSARNVFKSLGNKSTHFTDLAGSTYFITKLEEDGIFEPCITSQPVCNRLGGCGFSGTHIPMENGQWVLIVQQADYCELLLVVLLTPLLQLIRLKN
ncbi:hypothetical protein D3C79_838210 [compost metagenome]